MIRHEHEEHYQEELDNIEYADLENVLDDERGGIEGIIGGNVLIMNRMMGNDKVEGDNDNRMNNVMKFDDAYCFYEQQ